MSPNGNRTRVRPLLDSTVIETTPNNWNRNNEPTLRYHQKRRVVKLSEPVRMRKSQDSSPTTKMLRLIGVPFHKSQRNSNAPQVPTSKVTPEKCVEHLNCAMLTHVTQEFAFFAVKPLADRHRNHLFCRTWPTKKRTQSNKNNYKQCGHPHCLKRTHKPGRTTFLSRSTARTIYRNTKRCFVLRQSKKHHEQKKAQLRLSYRTVIGCSSSSSA